MSAGSEINVHIEHLVLDGLPVDAGSGRAIRAGLQTELARLLRAGNTSERAESRAIDSSGSPAALGRQIARAVAGRIQVASGDGGRGNE